MQRILFKAGYRIVFNFVTPYDDIYFDDTIQGLTLEEARFLAKLSAKLYDGSSEYDTRLENFTHLHHRQDYYQHLWETHQNRLVEAAHNGFAKFFSENQDLVQKFAGVRRHDLRNSDHDEQIRLFEDFRDVLENTIVGQRIDDGTRMTHFEVQYFPNDVIVEDVTEDFLKG